MTWRSRLAGRPWACRNRTTLFDYLVSRPNEVDSMPTMTDDLALVKDILDRVLASGTSSRCWRASPTTSCWP